MKKFISFLLTASLFVSSLPVFVYAQNNINVTINGKKIYFDVEPQIINGRTMVPMRKIFEELGATVEFVSEKEDRNAFVYAETEDTAIGLFINESNLFFFDVETEEVKNKITIDAPATIVEGRTLVPVRAVSEALDCEVAWNDKTKTVSITTKETDESQENSTDKNKNTEENIKPEENDEYLFALTDKEVNDAMLSGIIKPSVYKARFGRYYIKPTTFDELGTLLAKSSRAAVATPKSVIGNIAYENMDFDTLQSGYTLDEAKEDYALFEKNKYCGIFFDIAYPNFEKNVDITIKAYQDEKEIPFSGTKPFNDWSEDNLIYSWEDLQDFEHNYRYPVGYKFSPSIMFSQDDFDITKDVTIIVSYNQKDMFKDTLYENKAKIIFNKGPIQLRYKVNFSKFDF